MSVHSALAHAATRPEVINAASAVAGNAAATAASAAGTAVSAVGTVVVTAAPIVLPALAVGGLVWGICSLLDD